MVGEVTKGAKIKTNVSHFVVKIQVSLFNPDVDDMMVYNEARDVQYVISPTSTLGAVLKNMIMYQGIYLSKI